MLKNFIPLLAIPVAILLPGVGTLLSPYTAWILGVLLFFSFLGLGFEDLIKALRHPAQAFFVSVIILVVTPLVIYPVMQRFFPEYFQGAILFMLLPSALSSPAVAAIYGGNVALATVNTVISNLLSPFSITLFLALFMSAGIKVSIFKILARLLLVILIPFLLGLLANQWVKPWIQKTKRHYRLINLSLLFVLFLATVSPYAQQMVANLRNGRLWLAVLVVHLVLLFFARLSVLHATGKHEKIAIESNLLFLNMGLGVVIAQNYFGPNEMLFLIFCQIVWTVLIGIFKLFK